MKTIQIIHELSFDRPIHEVWALLSDSQRMHAISSAGFSPYEAEDIVTASGAVERAAFKKVGPFTLRWREKMGEWSVHEYFSQARIFDKGPCRELTVKAYFSEVDGKTQIKGVFLARIQGVLGDVLAWSGLLDWMTRQPVSAMKKTMADYENLRLPAPRSELHTVSVRAKDRLAEAMAKVAQGPYGHQLTDTLGDYLLKADPHSLRRIRPLVLAQAWGVPEAHMIEACIAAHKAGVLSMRWVVICPRCRDGKGDSDTLSDVPDGAHCTSCNINFERDFVNNVELVFSPSAWLRALPRGSFCMMAPANVPHIKWQEEIAPGQTREKTLDLPEGQYRIRTVEAGGELVVEHDGRSWVGVVLDGDTVTSSPDMSGPVLRVRNAGKVSRSIVVENAKFSRNRLTIGRLATVAAFHDQCPEQLLRAKQTAGIGQVAILFSDLQKSTAMYEEIGDAAAYGLVVEHFEFIEAHVRKEGGVIVKTVGDAVMAAFSDGEAAIAAAMAIQQDLKAFNSTRKLPDISLKIGIHEGSCVAMRGENGMDFFGSTVNLAARLQAQAQGGEVVVSRSLGQSEGLHENPRVQVNRDKAKLPGFEETVDFFRIKTV